MYDSLVGTVKESYLLQLSLATNLLFQLRCTRSAPGHDDLRDRSDRPSSIEPTASGAGHNRGVGIANDVKHEAGMYVVYDLQAGSWHVVDMTGHQLHDDTHTSLQPACSTLGVLSQALFRFNHDSSCTGKYDSEPELRGPGSVSETVYLAKAQ